MENLMTIKLTKEEAELLGRIADSIREQNDTPKNGLANLTAKEILTVCKHGDPQRNWKVGDEKVITLKSGEVITLQIAGFNHDIKMDGSKAAVTFITKECLAFPLCINYDYTNTGGWDKCELRKHLDTSVFALLPDEWQEIISYVSKSTSAGDEDYEVTTSVDRLWIPSEVEVFGETKYSTPREGEQYEIFKDSKQRQKTRLGAAANWWERSPDASHAASFCAVDASGTAGGSAASSSHGVAFGFSV